MVDDGQLAPHPSTANAGGPTGRGPLSKSSPSLEISSLVDSAVGWRHRPAGAGGHDKTP